jgi:hypothetical protein
LTAALPEAPIGAGDAVLAPPAALAAFLIGAGAALGGRRGGEGLRPIGAEGGIARARAVEAHQAEARFGRRVLAPRTPAQGGEEGGLVGRLDAAPTAAGIARVVHALMRT